MNKFKKNIVIVGFLEDEKRSISIPPIGEINYFDKIEQSKNHQGYLIIVNNKTNEDIVSFDKKYRKIINKFVKVYLYNEHYKESYNKWSNIQLVNRDLFLYDSLYYWDLYDEYKNNVLLEDKKYTKKRLENITKLYNYLKDYKVIKTSKIKEDLNINDRMIQRYMKDINDLYNNIGYDYYNNQWYIIW